MQPMDIAHPKSLTAFKAVCAEFSCLSKSAESLATLFAPISRALALESPVLSKT